MRKFALPLLIAGVLTLPSPANAATYENSDVRQGAFVGARIQLAFGGKSSGKARAALAIAPTSNRISDGHIVQTRIGDGIALNFGSKPNVTLAGIPADKALGLAPAKGPQSDQKLGLSTGGWIAVGVGAVALGVAIYEFRAFIEYDSKSD